MSRWSGFPFTPARVLFVLPFFLMLCTYGIHTGFRRSSLIFGGLAVLYAAGIYSYFSKTGYLNKGYCVPYSEMAGVIRGGSTAGKAVVVVDTYSSIPDPLLNQLPAGLRVILLDGEDSAEVVREAARAGTVLWFWGRTRDMSPSKFVTRLEDELSRGRYLVKHEFFPTASPSVGYCGWSEGQASLHTSMSYRRCGNVRHVLACFGSPSVIFTSIGKRLGWCKCQSEIFVDLSTRQARVRKIAVYNPTALP